VDDAGDAEDQRQPGADEEQPGRGGEPVERLKEKGVEGHLVIGPLTQLSSPRKRGPKNTGLWLWAPAYAGATSWVNVKVAINPPPGAASSPRRRTAARWRRRRT